MNLTTLKSSAAAPFAHLFGRAPTPEAKAKAEEEEKEKDAAAKAKAEEEDKDKEAKAKAEEEEKEKDAAAKAKAEEEDKEKDGDKDKEKAAASAQGVKAERARWTGVLSNAAATDKGEAAITLLAHTDLSTDQIVATLRALPAGAKTTGLAQRMSEAKIPNPGTGGAEAAADGPQATAKAMMAVYDRTVGRASK